MINSDIQKLEPGSFVDLYELDATSLGGDRSFFHAHTQMESIWWQGIEYTPWPLEAEGFMKSGDKPGSPRLRVGNTKGAISILCDYYDDLVGAKVIRRRTLGKFLDASNFPDGNPTADPNEELPPEVWYIERKTAENPTTVEFELSSALDFNGVQLPRRQIVANICTVKYRSAECSYTGGPVADIDDNPTTDPAKDRCAKLLKSCKFRFGANNPLPFAGFPAAGLMR